MSDSVNHPTHYNSHPSGVECITITEHMNFNLGNAMKYIWRAGLKSFKSGSEDRDIALTEGRAKHVEDLEKAKWYLEREIERLNKAPRTLKFKNPIPITRDELPQRLVGGDRQS